MTCRNHDSSDAWISWSRYTEIPPSTSTRLISAMTSRPRPGRQRDPEPGRSPTSIVGADGGGVEEGAGSIGLGALDLERERRAGQQLGDRSLADDVAPVHDGDGVAGPLDLVEEMRGQHDRAALGHEREDHVAHVVHAGRVEPVHRLVEDQQLGVAEQAGGDAETLAHAHRVLRHPVVGAVQDADPLERRPDAVARRRLAGRGEDLQVLPPGQMAVEPGLVDDGPDPRQRHVAMLRGTGYPSSDIVPASAWVSPSSTRMSVVLPAPLGPR